LINAYSGKEQLSSLEEKDKSLGINIEDFRIEIIALEKKIQTNINILIEKFEIQLNENSGKLIEKEKSLQQLKDQLDELNKTDWQKLKNDSLEAENNIKLYEGKIDNITSLISEAVKNFDVLISRSQISLKELNDKLDSELPKKIKELNESLSSNRVKLSSVVSTKNVRIEEIDDLKKELAQIESEIETAKKNEIKIAELTALKSYVESEIRDWTFLCRAFDKTGIPVLKFENSIIEITSKTNDLLAFYDNQSRIKIETTKPSKDKNKEIETLSIIAIDDHNIPGISPTMDIKDKSGGEKVWYQSALQGAISICQNKGSQDLTVFFDEQDGSLDSKGSVTKYFEMLSQVHTLTHAYQTIIITHRTEIIDMIPQQVKLNNGILEIMN
jgi:DNA repair exonuclease SbcCD ATPase subunit